MARVLRSLRDENRAATHRSIVDAAFDLVTENGADGLTVEAVAERAGVSRRTFFNYFGSLEAALTDPVIDMLAVAVEEFGRRPAGEDPLASVRHCLHLALTEERLPRLVQQFRICEANPAALRHHVYSWHLAENRVLDALAERIAATDPVYAQTVAASALGVVERTFTTWLRTTPTDHPGALSDLFAQVDRAFSYLSHGLSDQPGPLAKN